MANLAYLWREIFTNRYTSRPLCKNDMQRIILFLGLLTLTVSCGITEIGGNRNEKSSILNVWGSIDSSQDGVSALYTTTYITALEYKNGYDWRSDQAVGSVKCSLVVYANNIPVMKIPVGNEYEVSSDPDMHRLVDGHLYTDFSTDSETVVKKDGKTAFRYVGRETLCDIKTVGGDVYTLGQSRDGDGFSFRMNGSPILVRENGHVIGNLIDDDDSLCFAFCEQIKNADGLLGRYYSSINGKVSQIAVRDDIVNVWDIMVKNDKVIYLASLVGLSSPVVIDGDSMTALTMPAGASMVSCRLLDTNDKILVEGLYLLKNGVRANSLWRDGKVLTSFIKEKVISALDVYDGGVFLR